MDLDIILSLWVDIESIEGVVVGLAGEIIEAGDTMNSGSRLEPYSRTLNPFDFYQAAYLVSSG